MANLDNLNKEQKEACLQTEGPLLILAGAGSGKTSTMTHRIAHLIDDLGVDPYNILAVTFTNKAAGEMRDRVENLLGGSVNMWIMTFHAACLRILRRYADVLGYGRDFVVYDPVDTKSVMKKIIKENRIDDKQFSASHLLGRISDAKEKEVSVEGYESYFGDGFRQQVEKKAYSAYEKALKKNNAMDFDDLLLNTVRIFDRDKEILEKYQRRFRYIMVDEYQDTNRTQYRFVSMLAADNKNICVVGDDDQCIYQWRGADISNILDFEKDFPGAKVIKLEQNYRSTGNILAAAHSVIENNTKRKDKKLWTNAGEGSKITYRRTDDEKEEAHYIAQEISRMKKDDRKYSDFAILYRTNSQSRNFEDALSRYNIPYRVVGGLRYYDRKEIKDIVAYMRLVQNPDDDLAMMRIINEPKRGIGSTTQEKLTAWAGVRNESVLSMLRDSEVLSSLPKKAAKAAGEMAETLFHYHEEAPNLRVSDIYDGILAGTGYMAALESANTPEAEARIENIMEFKSVIYDYEKEGELSLADFLEKIALLSDIDNHDASEDAVALMTMHSAKGLEFPFVFMPGLEDGLFPGWRSVDDPEKLEEERRLCYVGMTRAKERLWLTSAGYRVQYGKGSYTRESEFLREIDPRLLDGDGVYQKKNEIRFGETKPVDGYSREKPFKPFDRYAAAKKETAAAGAKKAIKLAAGDEVRHGKFGHGTVLDVSGKVVRIAFDDAGIKKLAADIAPLEKL